MVKDVRGGVNCTRIESFVPWELIKQREVGKKYTCSSGGSSCTLLLHACFAVPRVDSGFGCWTCALPPSLYKKSLNPSSLDSKPFQQPSAGHQQEQLKTGATLPLASMGGMKMSSHGRVSQRGGGLSRMLREQKAKLYIIRRCVVMLLCWHD
ncbi:hypothetical protein BHE74_00001280 [Ensete ventricosum]|nr:hypothetical protein BHE74_00001280 [Ensete ventricosum]